MIKSPNFVLFVTFVVKIVFSFLVAALSHWVLRGVSQFRLFSSRKGNHWGLPLQFPFPFCVLCVLCGQSSESEIPQSGTNSLVSSRTSVNSSSRSTD